MEETINISALNAPAPNIARRVDPDRNRLDLSGIINNTSIEDRILADPEALNNPTIAQNIQTASDLTNRANILEQSFNTASEDLSSALGGRVFAGPGQANALAQRRNLIDAERREVVSALELVRGNNSTASSLRSESQRLQNSTASSIASSSTSSNTPVNTGDFDSLVDGGETSAETIEQQRRIVRDDTRIQTNNAILDVIGEANGAEARRVAEQILTDEGADALENHLRELQTAEASVQLPGLTPTNPFAEFTRIPAAQNVETTQSETFGPLL